MIGFLAHMFYIHSSPFHGLVFYFVVLVNEGLLLKAVLHLILET